LGYTMLRVRMYLATVAVAVCTAGLGAFASPSPGAGPVAEPDDVTPTISAPASVAPGSVFTITISVANLGPGPAHRVATDFYFGKDARLHKDVHKGQLRLVGVSEDAIQVGTFVHWRDETILPFEEATHTVTLELSRHARLHSIVGMAIVDAYEPEETDDDNNTASFAVAVGG